LQQEYKREHRGGGSSPVALPPRHPKGALPPPGIYDKGLKQVWLVKIELALIFKGVDIHLKSS